MVGAAIGSFAARAVAHRFGIVNAPNPIVPQHTAATAYLGGVGVLCGLVFAWTLGPAPHWHIMAPACLYCAFGVVDDVRPFNALAKLVGQTAIAVLAVCLGLRLPLTGMMLVDQAVTVFWVVMLVNAVNFTDVCDGLVAGLGATFFLCWALLSPVLPLSGWAGLAACLGFLPFNLPKASMFLGDAGSHLIGFLMAALLASLPAPNGLIHVAQMMLVAVVPLFELVFITFVRLSKGIAWWKGSPDHFSLRLQQAGWSRMKVDVVAWSLMAFGGVAGLMLPDVPLAGVVATLLAAVVLSFAAARFLLGHEVRRA